MNSVNTANLGYNTVRTCNPSIYIQLYGTDQIHKHIRFSSLWCWWHWRSWWFWFLKCKHTKLLAACKYTHNIIPYKCKCESSKNKTKQKKRNYCILLQLDGVSHYGWSDHKALHTNGCRHMHTYSFTWAAHTVTQMITKTTTLSTSVLCFRCTLSSKFCDYKIQISIACEHKQ